MNPCILHHKVVNVPRTLIYIWEWSIHYGTMFTPLNSSTNQELFKKYVCNQSSHYEKYGWCCMPWLSSKLKYLLPFSFSHVRLVTHQQYKSKTVWNYLKVATINILTVVDDFPLHKGSHRLQPPNQCFSLPAEMNGTQRKALVSPWRMHCTYCGMQKGTAPAKATSNREKIKPVALL